ncbi:MAG: PIN domain-containing protein [Boseongicola sp.]|nr:PIN domain-containing protein [Boseongicola sp.]
MKVLIDACVLYPTVLREIVIGVARRGLFTPLWSPRILEEWRRGAERRGENGIAEVEIASLIAMFPDALVHPAEETEARLSLPDSDDIHVLAASIDGRADELLTLNLKDFPTRTLARDGIQLRAPDSFLLELFHNEPNVLREVLEAVLSKAEHHGIDTSNPRALLKRARLPRLGKALYAS